jgi:hypothetical protein
MTVVNSVLANRELSLSRVVTSLSIELHGSHRLWPSVQRLVVIVWSVRETPDVLVAYGVKLEHGRGHAVFEAVIPRARLTAFLTDVIEGNSDKIKCRTHQEVQAARAAAPPVMTEVLLNDEGPVGPTVVLVDPSDPKGPGPKISVAVAVAIGSNEHLADAGAHD